MLAYEQKVTHELQLWQQKMLRKPGYLNKLSKALQDKLNSFLDPAIHFNIDLQLKNSSSPSSAAPAS